MVPRLLEDPVVGIKVVQAHRAEEMTRVEAGEAPTMEDLEMAPTAAVAAPLDKEAAPAMGVLLETVMTP